VTTLIDCGLEFFSNLTFMLLSRMRLCILSASVSSDQKALYKTIRFRHPDYNPDRAQKLISSFMSRHLSTCNISSKSMHAFLSNLANRQTDRRGQTHLRPPLSEVMVMN